LGIVILESMISRFLEKNIQANWGRGKAILVLGPRQVGKTTLLKGIAAAKGPYLYLNCDDGLIAKQLEGHTLGKLQALLGKNKVVLVDEAQRVHNIGLSLKLIIDEMPDVQLLVSGSSALELANQINEPLTGRKWEYHLYPISFAEWVQHHSTLDGLRQLPNRLIYGMYPDILNHPGSEISRLEQLCSSNLYKDLLSFGGIRKPQLLDDLLRALAYQIGNEVSYNELSRTLGVDKKTVIQYIQLLEQAFVIFRLPPYSHNHRNEISTNRKIYFLDNGLRNALIGDFKPVDLRNDVGALWENFLISEKLKNMAYKSNAGRLYFWRTKNQQEVDLVHECNGTITAYEIKWDPNRKIKSNKTFLNFYPNTPINLINPETFLDFLIE